MYSGCYSPQRAMVSVQMMRCYTRRFVFAIFTRELWPEYFIIASNTTTTSRTPAGIATEDCHAASWRTVWSHVEWDSYWCSSCTAISPKWLATARALSRPATCQWRRPSFSNQWARDRHSWWPTHAPTWRTTTAAANERTISAFAYDGSITA